MQERKQIMRFDNQNPKFAIKINCPMEEKFGIRLSEFFSGPSHQIEFREPISVLSQEPSHNETINLTKTALN